MGGKPHFVEEDAGLTVPAVELVEVEVDVGPEEAFNARDTTEIREKLHNAHELVRSQDEQVSESDCWEVESLFADALEGMGDQQLYEGDVDACSLDEALTYRKLLRSLGADAFILSTLDNDSITAKKLCTAFGIRPPAFLEGAPDAAYIPLLSLGISRELSKRVKLPQYNTIEDVIELLQKSTNIILLTGAGISTSLGIPDFRSKETGLYSKLAHLGLTDPQEVFDIEIFKEDPGIFYSIAKDILPTTSRYSPTHAFIKLLQDKEKLLTNFSQNIDNLEAKAGVRREKLIQCHGSFASATCVKCGHHVDGEEIYDDLKAGKVAVCPKCTKIVNEQGVKRKRATNGRSEKSHKDRRRRFASDFNSSDDDDADESDNVPQPGVMKPDITFFGENLPDEFHDRLRNHDRALVDLVIVIGTSLKVAPVSEVVSYLPANVPQLYISRTPVSHVDFDVDLLGDCDVIVAELCRRAGWNLVHEMVPPDRSVRVELQEGFPSRYVFTEEVNLVA